MEQAMQHNEWLDNFLKDSQLAKYIYAEECIRIANKIASAMAHMGVDRMFFTRQNVEFCELDYYNSNEALDFMRRLGYIFMTSRGGCLDITLIDKRFR
jgi:heme oxygenase